MQTPSSTESQPGWLRPTQLTTGMNVEGFDCGSPALNTWLAKYALGNQKANMTRTYVSVDGATNSILGFYALAAGAVLHKDAHARVAKGVARHDIPVLVLARLAVDLRCQGRGLGRALLHDALLRAHNASESIGARCLVVHAKDQNAKDFYLRHAEFEESPTDDLNLQLLMKDLRISLTK